MTTNPIYFEIVGASGGYRGHVKDRGNHKLIWWTQVYARKEDAKYAIDLLRAHASTAPVYDGPPQPGSQASSLGMARGVKPRASPEFRQTLLGSATGAVHALSERRGEPELGATRAKPTEPRHGNSHFVPIEVVSSRKARARIA